MDGMISELRGSLGEAGVLLDAERMEGYLVDQRDLVRGRAAAILRPSSTEQVQAIMRLASRYGVGIVPQAGNTSYCAGATPDTSGRQMVLSLERLNKVRSVDPLDAALSVDSGVILQHAQDAADAAGLMLPISLGSEGSCRIGGIIGTNAGGLSVLRYGMTRDLILGLEVVLPDGSLVNDMKRLRKNNTGYDIKQNFVGAEGTLGIVTGAVLKMIPKPTHHATAWVCLAEDVPLPEMLALVRRETGDLVSSFELITPRSLALVAPPDGPLKSGSGGVVLVELACSSSRIPVVEVMEGVMGDVFEAGWAEDVMIAQSDAQRADMWRLRETIPEGEKHHGGSVKHDISVPIGRTVEFLKVGGAAVAAYDPTLELSVYGHIGDGNLHYNLLVPKGDDRLRFTDRIGRELAPQLYDIAAGMGGSFSAEHGVGRLKRRLLQHYADPNRYRVLRGLKGLFDPLDVMNPGAMVDPATGLSGQE
ncbi:FAD-binding oxidoreductase [Ancylobacter sp. 6x-1]|uniref:FAD-binding oxidoreductase n=1 Tax=Ancylobacter crimeensis TaxID=2579147 RepID=A0ABT0D6Z7_9HYPH|nr:FAD-binding oxidoreductase [Ancylobacter crimeensis]MCK0195709.1 FAD-binding oxidoreductase [Ancylobacter crimeensis]